MALSAGSGPVPVEAAVTGNADLSAFARDQLEAELRREYEQRLAEKKLSITRMIWTSVCKRWSRSTKKSNQPDAGGYSRGTYPFSI